MILLTGASGFIGKYLLNALVSKYGKDNVVALTSAPLSDCNYILHNDYHFNNNYFIENGYAEISTIVHAGAFTPKHFNEANNLIKCNSNILNTNKLIFSNLPNLKKIIFISTLDVYGIDDIISEESPIKPISLYGHSKLYCEKIIQYFGKENDIDTQILRIGHVYGPGEEKYQKIIPLSIKKILENESLNIYGEGKTIRSFIYITDVVEAIINCIGTKTEYNVINIVGSEQISVKELIDKLIGISNKNIYINKLKSDRPLRNLIFNNNRLKIILKKPLIKLDEGLRMEWKYMLEKQKS